MTFIEVNGIRVYGKHGCMPEETQIGTWFEVDVRIGYDFTEAASSDDLSKTADYVQIRKVIEEEVKKPSKLIETVLKRCVSRLKLEVGGLTSIYVKLIKTNPPIEGEVKNVAVVWDEQLK